MCFIRRTLQYTTSLTSFHVRGPPYYPVVHSFPLTNTFNSTVVILEAKFPSEVQGLLSVGRVLVSAAVIRASTENLAPMFGCPCSHVLLFGRERGRMLFVSSSGSVAYSCLIPCLSLLFLPLQLNDFSPPIAILPQQTATPFSVYFLSNSSNITLTTKLRVTTNASVFSVPFQCYNGELKVRCALYLQTVYHCTLACFSGVC